MKIRTFPVIIISTFFYLGYLPLIPGTFGSIAGAMIAYLTRQNYALFIFLTTLFLFSGFAIGGKAEQIFKEKDSRFIVIDEVAGMMLGLIFLPLKPQVIILAFFIFRLLDTLKPFPAGRLQGLRGGFGIMTDDIIAGIYTNIVLQSVLRITSLSAS